QGALLAFPIANAKAISSGKMPPTSLGVRAIDDQTLEVRLEKPAAYLLELLTQQMFDPVPEHVIAREGMRWTKPGTMVSNGAYTLAERVPDGFIRAVKNPRYYDAAHTKIETVIYYPAADSSAEVKRYLAGEIDITDAMPPREIAPLRPKLGAQVHVFP